MNQLSKSSESPRSLPDAAISSEAFERLVHQAMSVFTKARIHKFELKIGIFMDHLRDLMKVDNCYFFKYDPESETASMTYRSVGPEAAAYLKDSDFQQIPVREIFPVAVKKIQLGKPLVIRSERDLKVFSVSFQKMISALSVKSLLYVPVMTGEYFYGAFGFDHLKSKINWNPKTVIRLQLLANILANVMERRRLYSKIEGQTRDIEAIKTVFGQSDITNAYGIVGPDTSRPIIGSGKAMVAFRRRLELFTGDNDLVYIYGEKGTGKQYVTKKILEICCPRGKMLMVDCALIEEGTFGHHIYSQGETSSDSWLEEYGLGQGGIIVMNHFHKLPSWALKKVPDLVRRVSLRIPAIKLIFTSERDPKRLYQSGLKNKPFLKILNSRALQVPPLRERKDDIPDFTHYFVSRISATLGMATPSISDEVMKWLVEHSWPGNLMELRNVIERAILFTRSETLQSDHIKALIRATDGQATDTLHFEDVIRVHILKVGDLCNWKIEGPGSMSEKLHMNPSTLRSKMRKMGIIKPR